MHTVAIPPVFNNFNLPPIFAWAWDKFTFFVSSRNSYSKRIAYYWTFTGNFGNLRGLQEYNESKTIDGVEYNANVVIQSPKYRGQKYQVTISLTKLVPDEN